MNTLTIVLILLALFPFREGVKDALMFKDLGTGSDGKHKKLWHALDGAWQILVIGMLSYLLSLDAEDKWYFFGLFFAASALWFWIWNDIIINVVGLNKPIAYIGNTSFIDRALRVAFGEDAGFVVLGLKSGFFFASAFFAWIAY